MYGRSSRRAFERVERAIGRGTAMGLNPCKDKESGTSIHQNGQQTRYVFAMAQRFVSCQRKYETWLESSVLAFALAGPIEGPFSFNGGQTRCFLAGTKVEMCLILSSDGLFHIVFVYCGVLCSTFSCVQTQYWSNL